jgi:hypothetical protein
MTNPFQTSGTSPTADFMGAHRGTLFLLIPRTALAYIWKEGHLSADGMTFGDAIVIEPRFIWAIRRGLQDDGFSVVTR